ncbi:hypothetical protein H0H92_013885 [Tricholoma furcatifolium]|nr:hypothetical protein H0H92_013885 [Tricholoma furcatifolium]
MTRSPLTHTLRTLVIRALLRLLSLFSPSLRALLARLEASPGLPVPNPSAPHWLSPPSPIATHGADADADAELPEYADVVVIGSGITGTSFARELLDWERDHLPTDARRTKVVMLEAREACSGATGRNGGHINPILYDQFPRLCTLYGAPAAAQIMRFRLAHLPSILAAAHAEGPSVLRDSQCREVDAYDVYHNPSLFSDQKRKLRLYKEALPVEGARYAVKEGTGGAGVGFTDLQLSKAVGYITTRAGALHPYRLVTGILSRLLEAYPTSFSLFTLTPCTSISTVPSPAPSPYTTLYKLTTPRGAILTPHVVHATNGWAGHLLPGMRGKIVPARNTMSAHPRPPSPFSDSNSILNSVSDSEKANAFNGQRSFVLFPDDNSDVYDYLTQQRLSTDIDADVPNPGSAYPPPQGELMFGGVFIRGNGALTELGNADDSTWDEGTGWYLSKALKRYFWFEAGDEGAKGKGKATSTEMAEKDKAMAKDDASVIDKVKVWSGILGVSVDGQPWVGRVPEAVAERRAPRRRRGSRRWTGRGPEPWRSESTSNTNTSESNTLSLSGDEKIEAESPRADEFEEEEEPEAASQGHEPEKQGGEGDAGALRGRGSASNGRDGPGGALAAPGEWIAAGYSGEGMVHAWLSGKVLAHMVLGLDLAKESDATTAEKAGGGAGLSSWFPPVYLVSEERWAHTGIEDLVAEFLGI